MVPVVLFPRSAIQVSQGLLGSAFTGVNGTLGIYCAKTL